MGVHVYDMKNLFSYSFLHAMSSVFVLEPFKVVLWHWEAFCVNFSKIPAQVCNQLLVGESHHFRSCHIQSILPVGHVDQICQTVQLCLIQ